MPKSKGVLRHPSDKVAEAAGVIQKPAGLFIRAAAAGDLQAPADYNADGWPAAWQNMSESSISQYDFRKRSCIPARAFREGKIQVRGNIAVLRKFHEGRLCESEKANKSKVYRLKVGLRESDIRGVSDGYHVRIHKVRNNEDFKKLIETNEWQTAKLLEADAFDYGTDIETSPGYAGPPNNEFIPLLGGPFSKNQYLTNFLDMQAKCFWVMNHHPLGKAAVTTLRNYVIGKGVDVLFQSPECQKIWDAFVKRTKHAPKLRQDVRSLIWAGEVMTRKMKQNGLAALRPLDVSTCWEIVTDPNDIDNPFYYHLQYPTQWQLVYKPNDVTSEYIIEDIPAEQIIHIKENVEPGEKRGRSDLYPALSWLKMYRDFRHAKMTKAQLEESYAHDIEVDGSAADVQNFAAQNTRIPPNGATFVHNKQVVRKYLQPTASSTDGREDAGEPMRVDIAVAVGIAPEWIGHTGQGASRANALVKEAPATRTIEDKQQTVSAYLQEQVDFVLETDGSKLPQTVVKKAGLGGIKKALAQRDWKGTAKAALAMVTMQDQTEPLDRSCEFIFPEISKEDRSAKIMDILKAKIAKAISHRRASTMITQELGVNNYDYDDEMQEIEAEAQSGNGPEWDDDAIAAAGKGGAGGGAAGSGQKAGAGQGQGQAPEPDSQAGGANLRQNQGA